MVLIYFLALVTNFGLGFYCHWKYGPAIKEWWESVW